MVRIIVPKPSAYLDANICPLEFVSLGKLYEKNIEECWSHHPKMLVMLAI